MDAVKAAAIEAARAAFSKAYFKPRSATICALTAAIDAYEQALWQPVETMPESGTFLAQTLGGDIERVFAWRSLGTTVTPSQPVWSVGPSHTTSPDRWARWRPMPERWEDGR